MQDLVTRYLYALETNRGERYGINIFGNFRFKLNRLDVKIETYDREIKLRLFNHWS